MARTADPIPGKAVNQFRRINATIGAAETKAAKARSDRDKLIIQQKRDGQAAKSISEAAGVDPSYVHRIVKTSQRFEPETWDSISLDSA